MARDAKCIAERNGGGNGWAPKDWALAPCAASS